MPQSIRHQQDSRFRASGRHPSAVPARGSVWLLEDSPAQAQRTIAQLDGYDIEHFADSASLLERLSVAEPDVLVLDLEVPEISGLEVLRFVRDSRDEATLPVLVLTGSRTDEAACIEALSAGANDFVSKPCESVVLRARLKTLLRIREIYDRARRSEQERTNALERASEAEMRSSLAINCAGLGIYQLDPANGVVTLDLRSRELMGSSEPATTLDAMLERIHPEDRVTVQTSLEAALDPNRRILHAAEYRVRLDDGGERWLSSWARASFEEDRPTRLLGALLDVTDRRTAAAELQRDAAFRELFIGILGHDLRTPLQSLTMIGDVLTNGSPEEIAKIEAGRRVESSTRRMSRMVADLLDFTRSRRSGGMPVSPTDGDLDQMVTTVLSEIQVVHPERTVRYRSTGDCHGRWDFDRLEQLLSNLVTNAIDYSPPGEAVAVTLTCRDDDVVLDVHNGGTPIAPGALGSLFDPFRRAAVKGAGARAARGLGLGLYIVQRIAEAHGGTATVTSDVATGTTFRVTMPRHHTA